jgi:hypothetical protein
MIRFFTDLNRHLCSNPGRTPDGTFPKFVLSGRLRYIDALRDQPLVWQCCLFLCLQNQPLCLSLKGDFLQSRQHLPLSDENVSNRYALASYPLNAKWQISVESGSVEFVTYPDGNFWSK